MRLRRVPAGVLDRAGRHGDAAARTARDARDRRVVRDFVVAWRRRDRSALARLFAPDGRAALAYGGQPLRIEGRVEFLAFVDQALANDDAVFEVEEVDFFSGSGQLAVLLAGCRQGVRWMTVYRVSNRQVAEIRAFVEASPSSPARAS
jgi:hypothetical protein